jgi:hypothetical protein
MEALPLRLSPGADLRVVLEAEVAARSCRASFVISGVGSLSRARLRMAGAGEPENRRAASCLLLGEPQHGAPVTFLVRHRT